MTPHQLELSSVKRDWIEEATETFLAFRHSLRDFTTDDIRPLLPEPENVNWVGILMAKLKNKGLVRRVSARPSERPEANGRLVSVWEAVC